MKNTILFLALVFISSTAFAQIQKGVGYFEGSLSGSYNKGKNPVGSSNSTYTNNYWIIDVSYGHYLTDCFAIGIGGGINLNDYKYENSSVDFYSFNRQTNVLYSVSPFIRASKKITDNFFFFGNLNLSAGTGPTQETRRDSNNDYGKTEGKQVTFEAKITGGLNYFLNRHFALKLSYGNFMYSSTTEKENESDDERTTNFLNLNLGLSSVSIGLQYFINNAEKK